MGGVSDEGSWAASFLCMSSYWDRECTSERMVTSDRFRFYFLVMHEAWESFESSVKCTGTSCSFLSPLPFLNYYTLLAYVVCVHAIVDGRGIGWSLWPYTQRSFCLPHPRRSEWNNGRGGAGDCVVELHVREKTLHVCVYTCIILESV